MLAYVVAVVLPSSLSEAKDPRIFVAAQSLLLTQYVTHPGCSTSGPSAMGHPGQGLFNFFCWQSSPVHTDSGVAI
jgi:hypothetical protein